MVLDGVLFPLALYSLAMVSGQTNLGEIQGGIYPLNGTTRNLFICSNVHALVVLRGDKGQSV